MYTHPCAHTHTHAKTEELEHSFRSHLFGTMCQGTGRGFNLNGDFLINLDYFLVENVTPGSREHPRETELSEGLPSIGQVLQGVGDLTLAQYHVTTAWTDGGAIAKCAGAVC